ncbi:MAG: transcriptional repressor [Tissierellaceae bacterium]|nr:transcriptional repressor [Tissierellaceae bacterium]
MDSQMIAEQLLNHGIKPSYPRLQIYKYLYMKRNHPTVDIIYNSLVKEMPTLSKTTVYNTLNLFIDAHLVTSLNLDENEKRYEIIIHDHSHFKCENCGNIYDIPYENIQLLPEGFEDFQVNEVQIFLGGICPHCKK